MTVIELGYRDTETPSTPRRVDRQLVHRVSAALLVLLCLATLTNSVPPRPRGLHQVWSTYGVGDSGSVIVGDTVVVPGRAGFELVGYALADGHERWHLDLGEPVPVIEPAVGSPVLLVQAGMQTIPLLDGSTQYNFTETVAIDAVTGRTLWRVRGTGSGWQATGTALLQEQTVDGRPTRLRLVRLTDGSTVWSRATPDLARWLPIGADPADPQRLALVGTGGAVRILDLADGKQISSGKVGWDPPTAQGDYQDIMAAGTNLYVTRSRGKFTLTAYDQETLSPQWTIEPPQNGSSAYSCGPVICLAGIGELIGYDWATGAVRWHIAGVDYAEPAGPGTIITESRGTGRHSSLIDAGTGRVLADLGADRPPAFLGAGSLITLGYTTSLPQRTVVNRVDPRTGRTFPLGTIDAIDLGCQLSGKLLVCHHPQGKLSVTAVG